MSETQCPGCGLSLAAREGPTHEYIQTSPECWALFNETRIETPYRLFTDAYMAQHPDGLEPRQLQSAAVHLVTLHAVLVAGQPEVAASKITRAAVDLGRRSGGFRRLQRPGSWDVTVRDVADATTSPKAYAQQVLAAWHQTEQPQIEEWVRRTLDHLYRE